MVVALRHLAIEGDSPRTLHAANGLMMPHLLHDNGFPLAFFTLGFPHFGQLAM